MSACLSVRACACACVCVRVCVAQLLPASVCVCVRVRGGKVICFLGQVFATPEIVNNKQQNERDSKQTVILPSGNTAHLLPSTHTTRSFSRSHVQNGGRPAKGSNNKNSKRSAKEQVQIEFDIECVAPTGGCLTQLVDRSVRVSCLPFSFDFHCEFVQCCQLSQLSGHVFAAAAS